MLRNGVRQLISMEPSLTVAGEAGNGRDGIALAESLDPDLILLDLNMPEMNGFETLDILRRKPLSGRVVVFSVSNYRRRSDYGTAPRGGRLSAQGYGAGRAAGGTASGGRR